MDLSPNSIGSELNSNYFSPNLNRIISFRISIGLYRIGLNLHRIWITLPSLVISAPKFTKRHLKNVFCNYLQLGMAAGWGFPELVVALPRSGENSLTYWGPGWGQKAIPYPALGRGQIPPCPRPRFPIGANSPLLSPLPRPDFNMKLQIYPSFTTLILIILKGI